MVHYFIEFRFQGKAKHRMKQLIYEVDKRFRLGYTKRKRPIPHITIIAPFYTKNQKQLVRDFNNACSKYSLIKFKIKGYGHFDNSRIVYINIEPSREMKEFRKELIRKIGKYTKLKDYDNSKTYSAHSTIAMKLPPAKFEKIKRYIKKKKEPSTNYSMVRATLIKGNKILYEYDFLLRKLLNRRQAKSKKIYSRTLKKLRTPSQKTITKELGLFSKLKRLFLR